MPRWRIDHAETEADGTIHVCRLREVQTVGEGEESRERTLRVHQLTTAIPMAAARSAAIVIGAVSPSMSA